MRCIKLTCAYDGTLYAGWQWQPGVATVQGALEQAVAAVTGNPARVRGASRTDAGVHALGQVAAFSTSSRMTPAEFQRALNTKLPDDVRIVAAEEAADDFDPMRMARRKRYCYTLHDGPVADVHRRLYCWHVKRRLDLAAMEQAAACLMGTHDFAAFQSTGSPRDSTTRTMFEVSVRRAAPPDGEFVHVELEADGFLYNMARAIVGSLVRVGHGRRPPTWLAAALASRDRRRSGPTAPAHGLCLVRVEY